MKLHKLLMASVALVFLCSLSFPAAGEETDDFAVPAFSDLPILSGKPMDVPNRLHDLPDTRLFEPFDLNRDLRLNEFDVKQFQTIVDSLNGTDLSGLEIAARFRSAQTYHRESFPLLYDLDRDGNFSSRDVESFSALVDQLGGSTMKGEKLVHSFSLRIFPPVRPARKEQE